MEGTAAPVDREHCVYGASCSFESFLTAQMLHLILFFFFGAICVAGAVNLLVQSHPINSALSLIVVMASLAAEYLLLGAEFVAAVQVIVYAGAIMVLFLITIMLLNAGKKSAARAVALPPCWAFPAW